MHTVSSERTHRPLRSTNDWAKPRRADDAGQPATSTQTLVIPFLTPARARTDGFRNGNVLRGGELVEQGLRISGNSEHGVMLGGKKLLVVHVGKEPKQEIIKPTGVQETDRLEVQAELEPGENLHDLLQGTNASGQCDKRIGELRHAMLALVHSLDGYQIGEAAVCAPLGNHRAGDDANDLASGRQCRIRQRAHETDAAAAIDDGDATMGACSAAGC